MKYFSEKLNKAFDTEEECLTAEAAFDKEQEEKKKQEELAVVTKKNLAKDIETAGEKVNLAYKEYDAALEEVKKLKEEYSRKAEEILNPAKKAIKDAQKERYDAIKKFNENYGVYTTTYTGDKAVSEFNRVSRWIDSIFPFDLFKW